MSAGLRDKFESRTEGLKATTTLNDGHRMPWLGFGVWQLDGDATTEDMVRTAIDLGYRSIDTARIYGNERGVGEAVRRCGIPREQLFVTTKVWTDDIRAGRIEAAFEQSMSRLGLDYVDLYLVHWPIEGCIPAAWRAMESLRRGGRVRTIGVSNHLRSHLDELLAGAEIVPAVNQIEFHPYLQSRPLVDFCRERGIQMEAWSPLMQAGPVLRDRTLSAIAAAHDRTVAQVILRWDVQRGVVTIPKTAKHSRLAENAGIFEFVLTDAEMASIAALDRNKRSGADPASFGF